MPDYALYHEGVETITPDEGETIAKIIQVMTEGQNITREKYGKAVRISHAKAHGLLQGVFTVLDGLPRSWRRASSRSRGHIPSSFAWPPLPVSSLTTPRSTRSAACP